MQYYQSREWRGKKALVTIGSEGRVVDLNTMTDAEFREFILWRMGVAQDEQNPPNLLRESVDIPVRAATSVAVIRKKVREYDPKRVGSEHVGTRR